jgi:hypothetical protein
VKILDEGYILMDIPRVREIKIARTEQGEVSVAVDLNGVGEILLLELDELLGLADALASAHQLALHMHNNNRRTS